LKLLKTQTNAAVKLAGKTLLCPGVFNSSLEMVKKAIEDNGGK
jgi:hypothetical protein